MKKAMNLVILLVSVFTIIFFGSVSAAPSTSESSMRENFDADRPFVFLIVDDTTGSILFMGKAAELVEY
jgi:serine protease inhibitor